jgi:hypothetical protein
MSFQITEAFHREYEATFRQLYQQSKHLLAGTYISKTQNAEKYAYNYVGEVAGVWDQPRHANTPQMDTPHYRRWCSLHKWEWADLVDALDEKILLTSPESAYIQAAVASANRGKDERILEAFGAAVLTGKEGTTTVNSYDIGECRLVKADGTVAAAGSDFSDATGGALTIAKLGTIGELLDEASVPEEGRHIVANPYNKWQLLNTTEVKSVDYNTVKALANGEINSFMGFTFHWLPTDRFTVNATNTTTACIECAAWHRDSMVMGVAQDITTRVAIRHDKSDAVEPYVKQYFGATRLQGKGVVRILLKKST